MNNKGASLIEVLVAIALTGIMIPALATALISSNSNRPSISQQLTATDTLQEMATATRSVREAGWSFVATDGTFHPTRSGSSWSLASGAGSLNGLSDQAVISDVQVDSSGNVVTSGGTLDPSLKLVTLTVSWSEPTNSTLSSYMYLSRWQNEASWTQTTQADFNADTLTNTVTTNVSGGEVQLASGQTTGSVESTTFDAGANAGFNYLSFDTNTPAGTSIEFQIASNNDNATWNYVGPDGTSSTFFTANGPIPLSASSNRYFRYKAMLSGTGSSTPVLDDITLSYSP